MSNLVYLDNVTRLDIPAERVLNAALDQNVKKAVVLAYGEDGEELFFSSIADGADVLWLMERLKMKLLSGDYE